MTLDQNFSDTILIKSIQMFTQNFDYQAHFGKCIELFASSAQNLENQTLSEIYNIIQDVYGSTNDEFRKNRETTLINLRNSDNWKKYILHLFQILCFFEIPQKEILERFGFEISSTIGKLTNLNKDNLNMDELITLVAANLYTLFNKEFPVKVLGHLARALSNLFQIGIHEKSTQPILFAHSNFFR